MPIPIYVIAFADATAQRQKMADQLTQMQLACAFIDAVDGRAMDETTRSSHISDRRQSWIKRQISAGATGCALSHYECWRQLLASDAPCALILEDDAHLDSDTPSVLSALATQADKFDIITLHRYKNRPATPFSMCRPRICTPAGNWPACAIIRLAPLPTSLAAPPPPVS